MNNIANKRKTFYKKEINIIKDAINKYSGIVHYRLNICGKKLTILIRATLEEELPLKEAGEKSFEDIYHTNGYLPMLRFILVDEDEKERFFGVERYCFRGSIDDWIPLGGTCDLEELAKKYCRHLGRMSFYELI